MNNPDIIVYEKYLTIRVDKIVSRKITKKTIRKRATKTTKAAPKTEKATVIEKEIVEVMDETENTEISRFSYSIFVSGLLFSV